MYTIIQNSFKSNNIKIFPVNLLGRKCVILPRELKIKEKRFNIRCQSRDVIYPVLKGSGFAKRRGVSQPFNKTTAL
jgi:hypothetical protein